MSDITARVGGAVARRLSSRPSITAESVAVARAIEHRRPLPERVVDDPYADLFLGRAGRAALAMAANQPANRLMRMLDPGVATFVVCRHRFIDDHLRAALDAGAEQVVLLGAGYDRLGDVLPAAGFDVGAATFIVWEGVSMYLTRTAVKATVAAVHGLTGPGSTLTMDGWYLVDDPSPRGTAQRVAPGALSLLGEPVTFGVHPEEMPCFLAPRGWDIADVATAEELEHRYCPGRRVYPPLYVLAADRSEAA